MTSRLLRSLADYESSTRAETDESGNSEMSKCASQTEDRVVDRQTLAGLDFQFPDGMIQRGSRSEPCDMFQWIENLLYDQKRVSVT